MIYRNTAFQLFGRGSALISGLASVLIFFQFLGNEAYGVVGVYLSLLALSGLFDLGLPVAVNRQISLMRAEGKDPSDFSRIIRSVELLIIGLSLLILLVTWNGAHLLTAHWLKLVSLDPAQVGFALQLAAIAVALRFPIAFYNNCLFAFDHHARANIVTTIGAIARLVVPLSAFSVFEPSLQVFFICQIAVNGAELMACALMVWTKKLSFFSRWASKDEIRPVMKLTLGLTGISITALVLSQLDKIILTRFITLDQFGIYSAAYSLAMGLLPIAYAIGNASFPAFSRYLADARKTDVQLLLRKSFFLQIILILPLAGTFVFFSDHLNKIALHFFDEAPSLLHYLALLGIGAFIQCFTVLLHGVRLAQGKPVGLFLLNLSAIGLFGLLYYLSVKMHGVMGVCLVFIGLNLYIVIAQVVLHLREPEYQKIWQKELARLGLIVAMSSALYYVSSVLIKATGEILPDMISLVGVLLVVLGLQLLLRGRLG